MHLKTAMEIKVKIYFWVYHSFNLEVPGIPPLFRDPILDGSICVGTAATSLVGSDLLAYDLTGDGKLILADMFSFFFF